MATSSSRLGLYIPTLGDQANIVTTYGDWVDDIDAAVGAQVFTASTRPASGFSGKEIYESTTGTTLVWTGSAWRYIGLVVVSSLASVTGTHTGQLGFQTSDNTIMRWTGSAWTAVGMAASAVAGQGASYSRLANQSAANNTDVFVDFDTTEKTTTYITKTTSTGSVFTINVTGFYFMTAQARWETSASTDVGRRDVHIVNGANTNIRYATNGVSAEHTGATSAGTGVPNAAAAAYLTAGDTIKIMTNQNSGGTINLKTESFGIATRVTFLYGGS